MINQIKVLRARHSFTQSELAKAIGVSRQTINAIEKGKFSPSLETAFRLAKVFSCSIEEIFEWKG